MDNPTDLPESAGEKRREREPWPYTAGEKGVNRVRVYDRDDCTSIQIEWWDDRGRIQRSLRTIVGEPVTDRDLARDIADRVAEAQEVKRNAAARRLVFGSEGMVLEKLLEKLHEKRGHDWSDSYRKGQERRRDFWLKKLGAKTSLIRIGGDPTWVEEIIRDEAEERGWSPRTQQAYLRYLIDAFIFARRKLKVIEERHDLSAVDVPSPNSKGKAYSEDEAKKLIPALMKVDPRAGIVGEAYYQAGRRLTATRTLRASAVRFTTFNVDAEPVDVVILSYPAETDKVGEASEAVLVGDVVDVVKKLLDRPAVRASGLLMPHGDLDATTATEWEPVSKEALTAMLHDAEEAAGVRHVKYRAYHGLKRRFAGSSAKDREIASLQSGTTTHTLRRSYDPDDDLPAKAALAVTLDRRRR